MLTLEGIVEPHDKGVAHGFEYVSLRKSINHLFWWADAAFKNDLHRIKSIWLP